MIILAATGVICPFIFSCFFRLKSRYDWFTVEGLAVNCKLLIAFIHLKSWISTISMLMSGCFTHWYWQGIDHLRPSVGLQVQKPNIQNQNQYLLASQQQQQALAQAQAQGNLNSPSYGYGGLPRGNFNAKDGQPPRNDGSICSPVQSNSPKVRSTYLEWRKVPALASYVLHCPVCNLKDYLSHRGAWIVFLLDQNFNALFSAKINFNCVFLKMLAFCSFLELKGGDMTLKASRQCMPILRSLKAID